MICRIKSGECAKVFGPWNRLRQRDAENSVALHVHAILFKSKMRDSEAPNNSTGMNRGSAGFSGYPSDCEWPHPQVVGKVFYTRGVTSREIYSAAFESTEPELFHAVCDSNVTLVEKLLVEKHDPNAIFRLKTSFEGENRSYSQYALHRAVQTGNKDLVHILLKHGSDPNCRNGQEKTPLQLLFRVIKKRNLARDYPLERRSSDPVIVEMLLKAGADLMLSDHNLGHITTYLTCNGWSLLEILITAGTNHNNAILRHRLIEECLFTLVTKCGQRDSNGKCGYGVLKSCLEAGLTPHVLRKGLEHAIQHNVPNAVLLLIKAGADVNFVFTDSQDQMVTPFGLALNLVTTSLDSISKRPILSHLSCGPPVIYACGYINSLLSVLWLLAKSGAISTWSRNDGCRLVQFEVALRSAYQEVGRLCREKNWSSEHHSAAQHHIQRCLDILQEIQPPMSLLDFCRIAVRQALGTGLEDKLAQLGLPVPVRDCILLDDLQDIVDGIARYEWPGSVSTLAVRVYLLHGHELPAEHFSGMDD